MRMDESECGSLGSIGSPLKKRSREELNARQRSMKIRDLASVLRSEGIRTAHSENNYSKKVSHHVLMDKEEGASQTTDASSASKSSIGLQTVADTNLCLGTVDSTEGVNSSTHDSACFNEHSEPSMSLKSHTQHDMISKINTGLGLDLNEADVSNTNSYDPFHPLKKSRLASERASNKGSLEEIGDPMRLWKEIKNNGFLSISHGCAPEPKRRGGARRSKGSAPKKKSIHGMYEQASRPLKITAPIGLLNGLNPGIIKNVRNTKQVRSIIDSLLRSEMLDGQFENENIGQSVRGVINKEAPGSFKPRHDDEQTSDVLEGTFHGGPSIASYHASKHEADSLKLNLAPENTSCISVEEFSAHHKSNDTRSVKAATVACQWLDLLHQDIRGRLAALRRSRKRVRTTIQRDLPVLFSKDFLPNQENDSHTASDIARWKAIFAHMEKALSDEGKHLENWLNQMKEMKLHCQWGLQSVGPAIFPPPYPSENSRPMKEDVMNRELAVSAAAASIYSTSSVVITAENMS
ncbi:hypothetical protein QJS04_geneDACA017004 [Acorus gramineus]|uniref:Uncharacterized protein n=1 Tax=Acorus gramineus TaxID=55184 RepID=A0AAV9AMS3_ACOGR|nr:hypothetical protein QJS04_geneDACA017004 [Acorus gramineus]